MEINLVPFYPLYPQGSRRNASGTDAMTVTQNGLSLTTAFYKKIGSPKYVELAYDETNKLIGIRGVNKAGEETICIGETGSHSKRVSNVELSKWVAGLIGYDRTTMNLVLKDYVVFNGYCCFDMSKGEVVMREKRSRRNTRKQYHDFG